MKKKNKESDSRVRYTKEGTQVIIKKTMAKGIYLVDAVTRSGVFTTLVAEEGLQ